MEIKLNIGDLVIDTSEQQEMNITSIGYIRHISKSRKKDLPKEYRTTYQVYWLNPDPGLGDCYIMRDIESWVKQGIWQIIPVN
jgi:hypothetical protein